MKRKHKAYLKLNILSLFLIAVSFISVTLAWFAYSGLSDVSTEVDVKAWYIAIEKDGQQVSNDIVITLDEIYPGMEITTEKLKIQNLGDSDATVKYSIASARILDNPSNNYEVSDTMPTEYIEDLLSHEFPFKVNINIGKKYIEAKGDETEFKVSVSWPLESDNDTLDSEWGNKGYEFQKKEETKKAQDENYQIRPSIQIVISVTAEQFIENDNSSDKRYNLGDFILYDVLENKKCETVSPTCLKTYILDSNNKLGDDTVTLLPNPFNTYTSGSYNNYEAMLTSYLTSWNANTRFLTISDIMSIIENDVENTVLVRNNLSDSIVGNLDYGNRLNTELTKAINYNGYYRFENEKFGFLSASNCYWIKSEYNTSKAFALKATDEIHSQVYGKAKEEICNMIPVIVASKTEL